ncbi:hypothetical protein LZ31DRAFT_77796 [Colletotrichum somersetense]|nr:hypothetical protein LZ31DRAFT_77796 [Colletotrichum somersetense]
MATRRKEKSRLRMFKVECGGEACQLPWPGSRSSYTPRGLPHSLSWSCPAGLISSSLRLICAEGKVTTARNPQSRSAATKAIDWSRRLGGSLM